MSAAIEHPIGPYTVEDWLALDPSVDGSRLELILGYLHVTPAPTGEHQWAASILVQLLRETLVSADRTDLYVVPAVNVRISTPWRTALIPDVVVLDVKPRGVSFAPDNLQLAVEIWSPGNDRAERETKLSAYAGAGVPFVWTLEQDKLGAMTVTAYRLDKGKYVEESQVKPGSWATITAAPVPVRLDPAQLTV